MEERKNVAGLTPKRADIIVPGLDILICILRELGVTRILVSDAGILDGLLLRKQN
jgi:exopolyphosphatase/guanosine-5'-triphosphate,3'-diphosphate pyrophosphatase